MNLTADEAQLGRFGTALGKCLERIDADISLRAVAGSLGDTMEIDDLTDMLEAWAEGGTYFRSVICSVA